MTTYENKSETNIHRQSIRIISLVISKFETFLFPVSISSYPWETGPVENL